MSKRTFAYSSTPTLGLHARLLTVFTLAAVVACSSDGAGGGGTSLGGAGSGAAGAGQSGASGGGAGGGSAGAPSAGAAPGGASGIAGGGTAGSSAGGSSGTAGSGGSSAGAAGSSAGAGGSGGSSGAAGVAGAPSSSTSGCSGKTYKLCEDFETGATGAVPTGWTKFKGYSAGSALDIGLATDQFHSGKMAVKSDSAATGQSRIQHSLSTLGATASKHWGRIFYKVQSPSPVPSSGVFHVTFLSLDHGTDENRVVDVVENSQGKHQWLYNNPNDKGSEGSAYDWAFDNAWHCAEWYVDVGTLSYRFFTDSKEVTSIGFTNKADSQMANYTAVIVGAEFYQMPSKPFIMWFDDLAIDDTQIGCQ